MDQIGVFDLGIQQNQIYRGRVMSVWDRAQAVAFSDGAEFILRHYAARIFSGSLPIICLFVIMVLSFSVSKFVVFLFTALYTFIFSM